MLAESDPDRLAPEHELERACQSNRQIKEAIELLEHVVAVEAEILARDDHSRQLSKDLLQRCYERSEGASAIMESGASVLDVE